MTRGAWGEQAAAEYLIGKGYEILDRNYRTRWGEIDLVAVQGRFLVFVEVKTRRSERFAQAREAVDARKQERLILTAEAWIQAHPTARQPRMDVIEVYGIEGGAVRAINHLENAFDA